MQEPNRNIRQVVLDTNALVQHCRPSNSMRLIGQEVHRGRMSLVVPELALLEAANRHREKVSTAVSDARRALKKLSEMGAIDEIPYVPVIPEQAAQSYEQELRRIVISLGAEISEIPQPDHRDLVERALRREQPLVGRTGAIAML